MLKEEVVELICQRGELSIHHFGQIFTLANQAFLCGTSRNNWLGYYMKLYMSFPCFRHDLSNLVWGRKQLLGFELNCWIRHRLRTPRNIYFSCAHAPKLHISNGDIEEELTFSQIPQRCDWARYSLSPSFLSRWWNYPKQEGGFRSSRTSRTRGSSEGSSSKPKITKYTTITATSARSPVIVSQTQPGSRLRTFMKVVFAHTMHR